MNHRLQKRIILKSCMGNHHPTFDTPPEKKFSFQPLLSYKLAKTAPTSLLPQPLLKELLPLLDWSLTGIGYNPKAQEWDFLTEDWSLRRRWRVLMFGRADHYSPGVYDHHLLSSYHSMFKQIDKDVKRTYPNSSFFDDPENVAAFSRILKNIALYFPSSGYTQGINFIVGFLLQCSFTEEETFWMFVHMSLDPDIFLIGLYEEEFPLANLSYDLFMLLMRQHYPQLTDRILQLELPKEIWIFQWFLTLFLNSFSADVCKMLWDYVMVSGPFGMVYLSLAIIDQTHDKLMALEEDSDFGIYFQELRSRQVLGKTLCFNTLFAKAKEIQLAAPALALAITRISSAKNYNHFYSQFYSSYDNPGLRQSLYAKHLKHTKKERLIYKMSANKSSTMKSSKAMNPIEFYMADSEVRNEKREDIPSLVLLRRMKESHSRVTQQGEEVEGRNSSWDGHFWKYPHDNING